MISPFVPSQGVPLKPRVTWDQIVPGIERIDEIMPARQETANLTLTANDKYVDMLVTAAATVTLPLAATARSLFEIKNMTTSTADVTVDANGAETIDGNLTVVLTPGESLTIRSDLTLWSIR